MPDISMITCRDTVDISGVVPALMAALRLAGKRRDLLVSASIRR